jgi:hypothetical protein
MNRERMDRYLEALRSGRYKQCRKAFNKNEDEFCAIGVGLDLMVREGLGTWEPSIDESIRRFRPNPSNTEYLLDSNQGLCLSSWLGAYLDINEIWDMNDVHDLSLGVIANAIEGRLNVDSQELKKDSQA